ncbi:GNAT family N-acetyltransferase [Marinomonas transparens]|uniref:GNAT family N-acetyltransferase n=1 Tax=Marinomonas transparens TaxID=2795388 RepID=A0A934JVJ2_9GAMM|nr:GNAT family N-acetyltransferase [Marinomonas transparens]MBJ7537807.1 GNAT family N-acetyltransferase [Marinomonas transparens]
MNFNVFIYSVEKKKEWDEFVKNSKNSHFMFYRNYMDYHSDRFYDFSLMLYDEKNRLVALLPANLDERKLYSHQGLTFGGLLLSNKSTTEQVYDMLLSIVEFLKIRDNVDSLIYKRVPDLYHTYPSQEDLYSLFLLEAKLIRRDVTVSIDLSNPIPYQEIRKRKIKKATKIGIEVSEENDLTDYWDLLTKVLKFNHDAIPVHSLSEIDFLRSSFPENIKCYVARLDGELLSGTIVYENKNIVHTQYLANNEKGRELGALDLVIDHLVRNIYKGKKYFDFGISTEKNGRFLNKGLIAQKEGFGARAFTHDFYEIFIND